MRRTVTRKEAVSVSLFPFLAVLICTMGALIVLLLIVVQQARASADSVPPAPEVVETPPTKEKIEQEDYEWEQEILAGLREKKTEQIASARLQLGHLEEHLRELNAKWQDLKAKVDAMSKAEESTDNNVDAERQQLAQLQAAIEQAKREVEDEKRKLAGKPQSFSIIPYQGANGTRRQPLYIECTARGVILQPENVVLTARDFEGDLGPGNPLDAALRAKREYFARIGRTQQFGEPYPLLIVRPDGVRAYAAAREAMKGWDDEFGYELVEQGMLLSYPPVDPNLGQQLIDVISVARRRQATLAAAMPSRYRGIAVDYTGEEGGGFGEGSSGSTVGSGQGGSSMEGESEGQSGQFAQGADGEGKPGDVANPNGVAGGNSSVQGSTQPGGASQGSSAGGGGFEPVASARGKGFAVPKSKRSKTGVTRYLRVAVLADRLVILPDEGDDQAPRVVMIGPQMVHQLDQFIGEVWDYVETWDIALPGGYWKPVLSVEVTPGCEIRFQELETLLHESGLQVERRKQ